MCVAGADQLVGNEICPEFAELDLGFVRQAKWYPRIRESLVIGSIQRGVIAQRMIQKIKLLPSQIRMYEYIIEELDRNPGWKPTVDVMSLEAALERISPSRLFDSLSPDDVEDIVAARLQCDGWILIKSTCFRSKPKFEFEMIHKKTGDSGAVQVKSGKSVTLDVRDYGETSFHKVFLFSTAIVPYRGDSADSKDSVECLGADEMHEWTKGHLKLLPEHVQIRLHFATQGD